MDSKIDYEDQNLSEEGELKSMDLNISNTNNYTDTEGAMSLNTSDHFPRN